MLTKKFFNTTYGWHCSVYSQEGFIDKEIVLNFGQKNTHDD